MLLWLRPRCLNLIGSLARKAGYAQRRDTASYGILDIRSDVEELDFAGQLGRMHSRAPMQIIPMPRSSIR